MSTLHDPAGLLHPLTCANGHRTVFSDMVLHERIPCPVCGLLVGYDDIDYDGASNLCPWFPL